MPNLSLQPYFLPLPPQRTLQWAHPNYSFFLQWNRSCSGMPGYLFPVSSARQNLALHGKLLLIFGKQAQISCEATSDPLTPMQVNQAYLCAPRFPCISYCVESVSHCIVIVCVCIFVLWIQLYHNCVVYNLLKDKTYILFIFVSVPCALAHSKFSIT